MRHAILVREREGKGPVTMRGVADGLLRRGLRLAGFLQVGSEERPGHRTVDLVRIPEGQVLRLAWTTGPGDAQACSFAFDPSAFAAAAAWLDEGLGGADVLLLDGFGKLELAGGGHRAAVDRALRAGPPAVLSLRADQLPYAVEALGLEEPLAACSSADDAAALSSFLDQVERAARGRAGVVAA